jgi:hypothetical protein
MPSAEVRPVKAAALTDEMLAPLEPECRWVAVYGPLADGDAARLAEIMGQRRDVNMDVISDAPWWDPVTDLDFLRYFPWLTWLNVYSHHLQNIDGLRRLPRLRQFTLDRGGDTRPVSLAPLTAVASSLRDLDLNGPVSRVGALSELTGVTTLTLRSVRMADLSVLAPITGLRRLELKLGGTRDLALLPSFVQLEYFHASLIRGLSDVSPLAEVLSLEKIFLESLRNVTELPSLAKLTRLRTIELRNMKGLADLTPLLTAPALEDVSLSLEQLQPEDIAPLAAHPALKTAHVYLGSDRKDALARVPLEAADIDVWRPDST